MGDPDVSGGLQGKEHSGQGKPPWSRGLGSQPRWKQASLRLMEDQATLALGAVLGRSCSILAAWAGGTLP